MIIESTDRLLWEHVDDLWGNVDIPIESINDENSHISIATEDGDLLSLRKKLVYCVGLDIKDYSKRPVSGQLMLAHLLSLRQSMTISFMHQFEWLNRYEPEILISTGDGAYVLFEELYKAFGYILTLNWQIHEINANLDGCIKRSTQTDEIAKTILPIQVRYALSKDFVCPFKQFDERWTVTGTAIVTAARLLSISSGTHFIVSDNCYDEMVRQCGLNGGEGNLYLPICNWDQSFEAAFLGERIIKGALYPCWNLLGTYSNRTALREIGQRSDEPFNLDIGDSDITSINAEIFFERED